MGCRTCAIRSPAAARGAGGHDPVADAPDDEGNGEAEEAGKALTLAELLDDGALPADGPTGTQQPVTLDGATALGTGPSVEDLVVAPENVVA